MRVPAAGHWFFVILVFCDTGFLRYWGAALLKRDIIWAGSDDFTILGIAPAEALGLYWQGILARETSHQNWRLKRADDFGEQT